MPTARSTSKRRKGLAPTTDDTATMLSHSNAAGHGSALERTSLPTTRRATHSDDDDVNIELLDRAQNGEAKHTNGHRVVEKKNSAPLPLRDRNAIILLIVLCKHILYSRAYNHLLISSL